MPANVGFLLSGTRIVLQYHFLFGSLAVYTRPFFWWLTWGRVGAILCCGSGPLAPPTPSPHTLPRKIGAPHFGCGRSDVSPQTYAIARLFAAAGDMCAELLTAKVIVH